MAPDEFESHLSRIETHWTAVVRAHRGQAGEAAEARSSVLEQYGGAVRRYLLASLGDVEAADELAQEFALRFLRGDFRNADPGKGRFRDYLKRALYHLMVDHHRSRRGRPHPLGDGEPAAAPPEDSTWDQEHDRQFGECWREQIMARAWAALEQAQGRSGPMLADVLKLRVARPELKSPALAEELSRRLGRPVNAGWVRINLHRARDLFVEALLAEVERSVGADAPDRLEEELIELRLLEYCRPALKRRVH